MVLGMQGADWVRRSVIDAPLEAVCRGDSERTLLESVSPGITAPVECLEADSCPELQRTCCLTSFKSRHRYGYLHKHQCYRKRERQN